jgi:DNA repair exonuclease SbcCD ATPase subunit
MALDLEAIQARAERAHQEISGICDGSRRWTMRVPVTEDDSDMVLSALVVDVDQLTAANADLTDRLDRTLHELREVAAQRDEQRAKVEALMVGREALQSRIWLAEECRRLRGERNAARAALADVSDLLDEARTERDELQVELDASQRNLRTALDGGNRLVNVAIAQERQLRELRAPTEGGAAMTAPEPSVCRVCGGDGYVVVAHVSERMEYVRRCRECPCVICGKDGGGAIGGECGQCWDQAERYLERVSDR